MAIMRHMSQTVKP